MDYPTTTLLPLKIKALSKLAILLSGGSLYFLCIFQISVKYRTGWCKSYGVQKSVPRGGRQNKSQQLTLRNFQPRRIEIAKAKQK